MKVLYDYEELIQELKEEISDEILLLTDNIQILRDDKSIDGDYKPIIDWYYDENIMIEDLNNDEHDIELRNLIKEQYEEDKPFLEVISVENCLIEMEERNRIL